MNKKNVCSDYISLTSLTFLDLIKKDTNLFNTEQKTGLLLQKSTYKFFWTRKKWLMKIAHKVSRQIIIIIYQLLFVFSKKIVKWKKVKIQLGTYLRTVHKRRRNFLGGEGCLKPNFFKKQCFFVIKFFTWGNNRGPKWQWSTQQANSMYQYTDLVFASHSARYQFPR